MPRTRVPGPGPGLVLLVLSLLAITALFPTLASSALQEQDAVKQLQKGIDKLQKGDPQGGLEEIQKSIEMEPRLAAAHYYAGMASAQMRQWQQAYDYFVAATQQAPGYGEAHMQACRVAYSLGNLDDAFEQAVLAARAGIDMTDAFAGLDAAMELPSDWRERIDVPRVMIGAIDTQALLQRDSSIFAGSQTEDRPAGADQSGVPPTDPLSGMGNLAPPTSSGAFPIGIGTTGSGLAANFQAELHEVRRRFGEELASSEMFGVVAGQELANYVLFIKVDDLGEEPQVQLKGFVKLLDPDSAAEIYSRPLELSNINSVSDLRNDVGRYVGYMEEWLREQRR